ncbi:MAG: type II toxin-antitoxin system ParD family antitoxin [Methylobacterium frigidaeris]
MPDPPAPVRVDGMSKSVVLDPPSEEILDGLMRSGRYRSEGDAVSDASRLLKEQEAEASRLRTAWREGVESGGHRPADAVLASLRQRDAGWTDSPP